MKKLSNHEVIAFLDSLGEMIGDDAKYIHLGLTSSDIMDTGLALQLKDAGKIILKRCRCFNKTFKETGIKTQKHSNDRKNSRHPRTTYHSGFEICSLVGRNEKKQRKIR